MNYVFSCIIGCSIIVKVSVLVFGVDLSTHPWTWHIAQVWLRVSSWLLWNTGQLSVHGKSKSVAVIPLWPISESFPHPWLHCGGGNETKTLFVSIQKCVFFSSDFGYEGHHGLLDMCFKHHLKCCDLEGAFQSLSLQLFFLKHWRAFFTLRSRFPTH